jgi:predicted alpha-1,2-mannosidase
MKHLLLILVTLAMSGIHLLGSPTSSSNLADLPDPLVGTDSKYELSHGNTFPAVFIPFGMSNWTPETGEGGWPYQYSKNVIRGIRSTHRPSAWMTDYGPLSLMPVAGELKVLPDKRQSRFRHQDEDARAYRYSVFLQDYQVRAEVTPSVHGGMLRFTFPKTDQAYVILDANPGGSSVQIHPESSTITGRNLHTSKGTASNFAMYFVAIFDRPFTTQGTWDGSGATDNNHERSGNHVGAYIGFSTREGEAVSVRVGTSLISLEQAERNLKSEIPESDFDSLVARARTEWAHELSRIEIRGGSEAQRKTFYTALYHAFQFPRILTETDANGMPIHYSPYDGKVHPGPMFSDTGFWDTFRAEFPLLTILQPKKVAEIIRAMLNAFDEGGWIPKWANPAETNVMIGTHGDSIIADAYLKGIRDYDVHKAYAAIRKNATQKGTGIFDARTGIEDYLRLGYVPADKVKESAASTLEYAYDDFCVAQMARALGKQDDYATFLQHSKNYRNLFDASTGFMRGRNSDGKWVEPFDPLAWGGVYTEGNAWQWLWSVQQDIPGLIQLLGGKDGFIQKLDTLFTMTNEFKVGGYGQVIHEMTEAKMQNMGQYAHINEPVHHVIYLYDYVGQPWKTQKWVHEVMDKLYKPGPDGWLGDEDNGQTSSWYIFSALGFYPVTPGQPVYALGSPLFDRATLHLENGKMFTVEAVKNSPRDIYVQSVSLNGQALDRPWITHFEIRKGGVLRFRLGQLPNKSWGLSGMPSPDQTFTPEG